MMNLNLVSLFANLNAFFSMELLEIGYIHKLLIMGKLQGLRPCNFQGNSWKLGASIIRVMGKLQGLRPCNFQGNSWKLIGGRVGGIHK